MIKKYWNKRAFVIFTLLGFVFGFFQITGWDLARQGNILWTGAYVARLLFACVLVGTFSGILSSVLACGLGTKPGAGKAETQPSTKTVGAKFDQILEKPSWVWVLSFVLMVISWLPCYLAYYPGICAYDTTIQLGQVVSGAYNDHHPIAHTLLLKGGLALGESLFGNANTGLGLFVLLQMLLLAAAFSWGLSLLLRNRVKTWVVLCLQLFFMLYPFHMYMSVSVCKDILFGVFFLLQMLALYEMIKDKARLGLYDVLFVIASVGMQLFRNNGRYAMLVLLAALFAAVLFGKGARRFWGRLTISCVLSLLVGSLCLSGLFKVTGAEQGDRREMLSMPIQQLARCMVYHGGVGVLPEDDASMEESHKSLINDFLLDEGYKEYRPDIADPVKRHTNTYVVRYRIRDFAGAYLALLGQYPGDFINAALATNAGYLYVGDESHAYINASDTETGLGYVQTRFLTEELNSYGVYQDSKLPGVFTLLEQWADENGYLELPVLKYLFMPGICLWLYLMLAGYLILYRKYDKCVPLALVMGYFATMLLGPTVQLRYIYPLMVILPFAAALSIGRIGQISGVNSKESKNENAEEKRQTDYRRRPVRSLCSAVLRTERTEGNSFGD